MALGTAAHCATLEPERFADSFAAWTGGRRAGKEWETFKSDAEARGLPVLTEDERDEALVIADAVRGCPEAMAYLRRGHAEVSMAWHDAETGTACKGRVDWLTAVDGADVLVGLKTTRDLRPRKFSAQAADLCYHWQWAFYCDGFQAITGRLPLMVEIVVESAAPHAVAVYRIPEHVLERGRQEYRAALTTLAQCEASGIWPGPVEGEVDFDLPGWAYPADEMTIEDAEEA
jgi:exodeoxyribonuclease VIII